MSSGAQQLSSLENRALQAADATIHLLQKRRRDDHWPSDYGGPLFLLPGLVITYHITDEAFTAQQKERMLIYLRNVQNDDGGWGLHIEGPSTVLGTALNYVAMRLLGADALDDVACTRARTRLHNLGGAEGIPTWGKFWLCVLGVYDWEGIQPLAPELWMLPRKLPLHPGNLWCHTRQVFLPMSFIYGHRHVGPESEIVQALRREVFVGRYESIDWPILRNRVAPGDVYTPRSPLLKAFNALGSKYERHPARFVRTRALRRIKELMRHEDESTGYLTIGPVSKAIQMLATWFDEGDSPAFRKHVERAGDYLWDGHDGLKMQGYNGSQFWDVAFGLQAMLEFHDIPEVAAGNIANSEVLTECLEAAHRFVDANQIRENIPNHERNFRDPTRGSWPFSTAEQGWSVSDCTAEGIKVALRMRDISDNPISIERVKEAVDVLLWSQNRDGGWSEYEKARGTKLLERLNAAEVFGDIMIGYSYVECTSACIQGLKSFTRTVPGYRAADIASACHRGVDFLRRRQREDGSFYGGWGVCFTYGTWFGIEGLLAAGHSHHSAPVQRATAFLLGKQRNDGSWGEAFASCSEHRYVEHENGQVVQTSWALLGLMVGQPQVGQDNRVDAAIQRGVEFLMSKQRSDGGWDHEGIAGVFNRNCSINYDNYRFIFPLWALSRFCRRSSPAAVTLLKPISIPSPFRVTMEAPANVFEAKMDTLCGLSACPSTGRPFQVVVYVIQALPCHSL
jgi:lanosterol synthase